MSDWLKRMGAIWLAMSAAVASIEAGIWPPVSWSLACVLFAIGLAAGLAGCLIERPGGGS